MFFFLYLFISVKSPVDGFALDGVECIHVHNTGDYPGPCKKAIRWVEVSVVLGALLYNIITQSIGSDMQLYYLEY